MKCTCATFAKAAGALCPFCLDRETALIMDAFYRRDLDAIFGSPSDMAHDQLAISASFSDLKRELATVTANRREDDRIRETARAWRGIV